MKYSTEIQLTRFKLGDKVLFAGMECEITRMLDEGVHTQYYQVKSELGYMWTTVHKLTPM
jgi:hypothetical protein